MTQRSGQSEQYEDQAASCECEGGGVWRGLQVAFLRYGRTDPVPPAAKLPYGTRRVGMLIEGHVQNKSMVRIRHTPARRRAANRTATWLPTAALRRALPPEDESTALLFGC